MCRNAEKLGSFIMAAPILYQSASVDTPCCPSPNGKNTRKQQIHIKKIQKGTTTNSTIPTRI